jgi:hypothetical protein
MPARLDEGIVVGLDQEIREKESRNDKWDTRGPGLSKGPFGRRPTGKPS